MTSAEPELVRALVRDVRAGRRDAFRLLVQRFEPRLRGLVSVMVRDAGVAEEIVQDAFVRAYRDFDRYDERRELFPWLATIAVRLAHNRLQRRARRRAIEAQGLVPLPAGADVSPGPTAAGPDPLADAIAQESRRHLWSLVSMLPQGERTAIYLSYAQGMSIADIARTLGVTAGTVKTWLFRARKKLRGQLGNGQGGE